MNICCIPAGTGGVAFYRMWQPYKWLEKNCPDVRVYIHDSSKYDGVRLHQEQMIADIIIYQCPWSEGIRDAAKLIKEGKSFGKDKKVVIELDDNLFNVDPWNEKYNVFGLNECKATAHGNDPYAVSQYKKLGKWEKWRRKKELPDGSIEIDLWRDGYNNFDIEVNKKKWLATKELADNADLVTVTTNELGKQLREIGITSRMAVLPNTVDLDRWLPMEKNDSDEIRIGWQGGSAHFDDLRLIIHDLNKLSKEYPSIKYVFMGVQFDSIITELPKGSVEWLPWHGDINTYPLVVREMKLDIGLCPLQNTAFNRGKSPLKWIEYSAMKLPSVVSDIVYSKFVDDGRTAVIAKKGQWKEKIEILIKNEKYRDRLAKKAYNEINKHYNIDQNIKWYHALKDLLNGSKIIRC